MTKAPPPCGRVLALFIRHPFHEALLSKLGGFLDSRFRVVVVKSVDELVAAAPDIVVSAESIAYLYLRWRMPWAVFVHTRHGLADKGVPARSFRAADYVCLTSEWVRDRFERRGIRPRREFWVTGYLQMDNLPTGEMVPRATSGVKTLLYAPTFQRGLSSIPMVGERIVELFLGDHADRRLVIRPHPLTTWEFPEWLAWVRSLPERDPRIEVAIGNQDVMPLLARADVLVSDASSVYLEYLALDRPIVLLANPDRRKDPYFEEIGLEWESSSCAQLTELAAHLPALLQTALAGDQERAPERKRTRDLIFAESLDGRCSERIAAKISAIAPTLGERFTPRALRPLWGRAMGWVLTLGLKLLRTKARK